jgi:predicted nucleic acid-binding protein
LRYLVARPSHEFWPDSISILDRLYFDLSRLGPSRRHTDSYFLGLAKVKKGQFVTLDTRLSAASVMGGEANLKRLI